MPLSNVQQLNEMFFNEFDKKYLCCCGAVHVKTGVLILIGLEGLVVLLAFIASLIRGTSLVWPILYLIIDGVTIACAVLAIKKEQRKIMWPIIIWKIICAGFFILGILGLIVLALIGSAILTDNFAGLTWVIIVFALGLPMIILGAFQLWQLFVFFKSMRYLLEKNRAKVTPTLMYSNGNTRGNQRVIQMQPPTQQWQQPGPQWTTQETQPQQPIIQQQFQQSPHPFEQPPTFNLPYQSHTPVQQFHEPRQQLPEQSAPHHIERQLSNPQEVTVQYQQYQEHLLERQHQQLQAYHEKQEQLLLQVKNQQMQRQQSQKQLVETHLLHHS
uniref:Uncharacterized protein n=1 Tax=Plectus sambesii TaxID=2011161 RepID=A0A914W0R4_9BILA